jgi:hypothetical protein
MFSFLFRPSLLLTLVTFAIIIVGGMAICTTQRVGLPRAHIVDSGHTRGLTEVEVWAKVENDGESGKVSVIFTLEENGHKTIQKIDAVLAPHEVKTVKMSIDWRHNPLDKVVVHADVV